jgi:hypothetical protein
MVRHLGNARLVDKSGVETGLKGGETHNSSICIKKLES